MRAIPPLTAACLLLATAAWAQDAPKSELSKDPAVRESLQPESTPQGTRPPSPETSGDTESNPLSEALAAVRRAPPDLEGNPVERPNPMASEPDDPVEPTRSSDPSALSSQEVK